MVSNENVTTAKEFKAKLDKRNEEEIARQEKVKQKAKECIWYEDNLDSSNTKVCHHPHMLANVVYIRDTPYLVCNMGENAIPCPYHCYEDTPVNDSGIPILEGAKTIPEFVAELPAPCEPFWDKVRMFLGF